jgi:hypothetical protein
MKEVKEVTNRKVPPATKRKVPRKDEEKDEDRGGMKMKIERG